MPDDPVIVVGAGPAGIAAAVALAEAGVPVRVIDHATAPGGAVHRAALPGAVPVGETSHRRRWASLMARAKGLNVSLNTRFTGIDARGAVLLTGAQGGVLTPPGVILALGARERVLPRPGWTLPGVLTAGALQIHLKTLGEAPAGRVLLAGSGPLLLAVGAQMAALGNPPVAIVEAARPFAAAALGLPAAYLAEGARHRMRLLRAGVPVLTGAVMERIDPGLIVQVQTRQGRRQFQADLVGLHDGIAPNDSGLGGPSPIPVLRAGDCREALGARAALLDGARAGQAMAAILARHPLPPEPAALIRERRAQALLARLFARDTDAELSALPPDTILCRCEGRTLADLRAFGPQPTARELRLTGRFGMGACQGRFCADWVARISGQPDLGRSRLPVQPLSIADLMALAPPETGDLP